MHITEIRNSWRSKWEQAQFRGAIFYVETDQRQSGRRVALHQYPKRNDPYAEDMGRAAIQITVQGYVIGKPTLSQGGVQITTDPRIRQGGQARQLGTVTPPPGVQFVGRDYLTMKTALIEALEQDGPGILKLPMQFQFRDLEVMVQGYGVTESRERGGMCAFNMQFVEYGKPQYRSTISTPDEVMKTSATLENTFALAFAGKSRDQIEAMLLPYTKVFQGAGVTGTQSTPATQR
jgi:prophage DNA circulation protein